MKLSNGIRILALSLVLAGGLFVSNAYIGIDLADEGYLWYGSVQTVGSAVPIRDFDAYDPGRYYWNATWMRALGEDGILALRLAESGMQVVGLVLGLVLLRRHLQSWTALFASAALLAVWFIPRHKTYDHVMAIALVFFALALVSRPTPFRFFTAGLAAAVAAFFGKNHGMYAVVVYLLLLGYLRYSGRWKGSMLRGAACFSSGAVVGYLPVIVMISVLPGFRYWFFQDIASLISLGTTNLTLPVPWPWSIDIARTLPGELLPQLSLGVLFVALPIVYVVAIVFVLRTHPSRLAPIHDVLIAAATAGVVYFHFALSRADLEHLAQSIHPFLITLLVLPMAIRKSRTRTAFVILLLTLSAFLTWNTALRRQARFIFSMNPATYVPLEIREDSILVPAWMRDLIETIRALDAEHVGRDEKLLIAPYWPGLYAILDREAPLRETYFLFEHPEERQKRAVSLLDSNRICCAIVGDVALDNDDERRFRSTHRLLWLYIDQHFDEIPAVGLPPSYGFFVRRDREHWDREGAYAPPDRALKARLRSRRYEHEVGELPPEVDEVPKPHVDGASVERQTGHGQ